MNTEPGDKGFVPQTDIEAMQHLEAKRGTGSEPRRWTISICDMCGRQLSYGFNVADHAWSCAGSFREVEVIEVGVGHDEQTEGEVEAAASARWDEQNPDVPWAEAPGMLRTIRRERTREMLTEWQPDPRTVAAVVEALREYAAEFWPEWKEAIETAAMKVVERFGSSVSGGESGG